MFKLIYKEKGISSFKAIANFAKENNIKKIGHTGTLDPLATGLLLVATDEDTKLIEYITNKNKSYIAEAKFNIETDTYDSEGKITKEYNKSITLKMIESILPLFIGKIKQIPPIFSAKKINGKRAYQLARNNQEVILKNIDVEIFKIKIISFENETLIFETDVSNGTYIRTLIHDMGKALDSGAHMTNLERTKVHGLDKNMKEIDYKMLIDLPFIEIKDEEFNKLLLGQKISLNYEDNKYGIIDKVKNDIIGIITIENKEVVKRKIFGNKLGKNNV